MKKLSFLLFPVILVLASLLTFVWWSIVSQAVDPQNSKPQALVVTRGMTASQVAGKLEEEGLIRSSLAFKFYTQLTGKAKNIQAGDYRLSKNLTLAQIAQVLSSGPIEVWLTIPEGFRREEIAIRAGQTLGLENAERNTFLTEFMSLTRSKEGFLFPDTYLIPRTASASAVVAKLSTTFEKRVTPQILDAAQNQGLDEKELITLASIVERETITEEERPIVAGILLKRLRAGWALQADATLQYAMASAQCEVSSDCNWWKPVTNSDKNLKSSYNTYLNRGLPPAPIANPGLSSIKAVANPTDSPYWYYLHDAEGRVHYAATLEEHEENIQRYLQ